VNSIGTFDHLLTGVNGVSLLIDFLFWMGVASAGFFFGSKMMKRDRTLPTM
jgi:hypothetical protein